MSALDQQDIVFAEVVQTGGLNHKYLRPADLRRLSHQAFSSRRLVEGLHAGKHQTRQRGQSIEFQDYREYMPGDPVQFVDWKVLGRTDKLFIKRFEHHADWTVHLLIDGSRSMDFRGFDNVGDSKYDTACRLAAAIGFLIAKQHDRFSFSLARQGLFQHLPTGGTMPYLIQVLGAMERFSLGQAAGMDQAVQALMPRGKRRDVLCLFSDLLDDSESLLKQLKIWLRRGGEVILFHIVHPHEVNLPELGSMTLYDSESDGYLQTDLQRIAEDYQQRFAEFLAWWAAAAGRLGMDFQRIAVGREATAILQRYFAQRQDRLAFRSGHQSG